MTSNKDDWALPPLPEGSVYIEIPADASSLDNMPPSGALYCDLGDPTEDDLD